GGGPRLDYGVTNRKLLSPSRKRVVTFFTFLFFFLRVFLEFAVFITSDQLFRSEHPYRNVLLCGLLKLQLSATLLHCTINFIWAECTTGPETAWIVIV